MGVKLGLIPLGVEEWSNDDEQRQVLDSEVAT